MNPLKFAHPLIDRYASKEMNFIWSPQKKFSLWRKLWYVLAETEMELGLNISKEQLNEMKSHLDDIDFELAEQMELKFKHDVMAHIHTFGAVCPLSKPIIHLGATSCFVGDNADIIQMKESLVIIRFHIVKLLNLMSSFSLAHMNHPCLSYTHLQPAQLTTVGKRCTLWMQDFLIDYEELDRLINFLPFRGAKGTTGTQATFLELFQGDHEKVKLLDKIVCQKLGFEKSVAVSGQTYTRKLDYMIVSALSGVAQTAYKMCGDIRLLASMKEIDEPFEANQIGSSAMAYKRNPMKCERVCSLSRYVMTLPEVCAQTHACQWMERSLDDSSCRRIVLPEAFIATDVILSTLMNIVDGLHIWPAVINSHVNAELPFMATELILMKCVEEGADRQDLHEAIRIHSLESARRVKEEGAPNDLLERIHADDSFACIHSLLPNLLDPNKFVGRAPEQVREFLDDYIFPVLDTYSNELRLCEFESYELSV